MKIEELLKLIDTELQWIYYYTKSESRKTLNINSNIYKDLIPMNYCKKITSLESRCCPCTISFEFYNGDISDLITENKKRGGYNYSPIEAYIKLYPDKKIDIINKLKPKENDSVIHYGYIKK